MKKKIFPYKSLTKTWPGGRRNATVHETKDTWSYRMWNRVPVAFKKPYTILESPAPSQGGMADPNTSPSPRYDNDGNISSILGM